jgi:hypothetical protein
MSRCSDGIGETIGIVSARRCIDLQAQRSVVGWRETISGNDGCEEDIGELGTMDALLNVKLVCHFLAVAGCPPPAGAVVVEGDRAGQPWTTRDPQHTFRSQTYLLSGTGRFHATWT